MENRSIERPGIVPTVYSPFLTGDDSRMQQGRVRIRPEAWVVQERDLELSGVYPHDVKAWIGPCTFCSCLQPIRQIGVLGTNRVNMEVDGATDSLSYFEQIQLRAQVFGPHGV